MILSVFARRAVPEGFKRLHTRRRSINPKYIMPSESESEMDRLEVQHYAFRRRLRKRIPVLTEIFVISTGHSFTVPHIRCGEGHWTVDMARTFPNSTFYGTDIAEVFLDPVPPNCIFMNANTLEGLPFEDSYFDFVYQR
ncbi:hypothetical protein BC937DRAFT_88326 [Endogone sp. FLAS-F59071]|nr:hypothetical protein BC937DRAFT_88326 [Endogone sp. FLAS-F59071]|eukprot:RUS18795.1 hypothetical protein BC937DRAFT_88326 [Endogone sp. FLAS-F59071]